VIVHSADVAIVKTEGGSASNAPDHLMRLFAYNQIMSRYGAAGLTKQEGDSSLVEMAKEAYVVSPVSSLVVLESQTDYKRFDINETDAASLKNASMNNNGAVPEPGEWAIIILVSAVFMYFLWKWKSI
jgi:XrtN system VIT domain protein